jgi:hypothetical protein
MDETPKYYGWTHVSKEEAKVQLTAITGSRGLLWPLPYDTLTPSLQKGIPNPRKCFISGYSGTVNVKGGMEAIGELFTTTAHTAAPESGKAYGHVIAMNYDGEVWTRGPFKVRDGHYYKEEDGVPLNKLFGKIDLMDLNKPIIEPRQARDIL